MFTLWLWLLLRTGSLSAPIAVGLSFATAAGLVLSAHLAASAYLISLERRAYMPAIEPTEAASSAVADQTTSPAAGPAAASPNATVLPIAAVSPNVAESAQSAAKVIASAPSVEQRNSEPSTNAVVIQAARSSRQHLVDKISASLLLGLSAALVVASSLFAVTTTA